MKYVIPFLLAGVLFAGEITLDDVLKNAEQSSATLQVVESKLARLDSAQTWFTSGANPELEVGTENFGISEFEVLVSQELRFNKQKEPARRQFELIKKEAALAVESARRELDLSVINAYLDVALIQDGAALIDSITESINQETIKLEKRFKAGAASQLELLEQKGLLIELKEEKFTLASEFRSALAALNSYSNDELSGSVESLQKLKERFVDAKSGAISQNHPEFIALEMELFEASLLSLESAASKTPGFSVAGGYKRNNEANENALLLGFSMELPFNKTANLVQLESEILASSVELKRTEVIRKLNADLKQLQEAVTVAEERLRILREERIPLSAEKADAAKVHFRHGNLPITEKIRFKRELIELQQEEFDLLRNYLASLAELAIFTGTLK